MWAYPSPAGKLERVVRLLSLGRSRGDGTDDCNARAAACTQWGGNNGLLKQGACNQSATFGGRNARPKQCMA